MSVTPKSGKHGQGDSDSHSSSPLAGGHKASFRSTKLARRARSFKEDFLEKISQMRSPVGTGVQTSGGGQRPHSPKIGRGSSKMNNAHDSSDNYHHHHHHNHNHPYYHHIERSPGQELDLMVRQVQVGLKHFRDVVTKDKLEMLSGNGTIVLDNVLSILSALKPLVNNDQSSIINSAMNNLYQCLARLIKLCDDVLLNENKSTTLNQEHTNEVVTMLEEAVQNLVKVARSKILNREQSAYKTTPRGSYGNASALLELPAQRNSLPDIPLTPRERQILEQTSCVTPGYVRSSHSSESILRDNSPPPPPKPPLPPDGICLSEPDSSSLGTPPPLPPKKRVQRAQQLIGDCCNSDSSLIAYSFDRMSFRSKSPEDSSSLLSVSAGSLDSVLNHSKEEDEIRALMDQHMDIESRRENDISDIATVTTHHGTNGNCIYDELFNQNDFHHHHHQQQQQLVEMNRLSNTDSGFVSIHSHSHRNSSQSYTTTTTTSSLSSKRSSQQSSSSSQFSTQQQNSFQQKSELIQENKMVEASGSVVKFSQSRMSDLSVESGGGVEDEGIIPPVIPKKTRSRRGRHERQPSPYDNVPIDSIGGELIPCSMHQSQSTTITNVNEMEDTKPPPLPAKKRHIMAYMEMFGNCSHSNDNVFLDHSSVQMMEAHQWRNQQSLDAELTTTQSCSFMQATASSSSSSSSSHTLHHQQQLLHKLSSIEHSKLLQLQSSLPPALPPKRSRPGSTKSSCSSPPPPSSPNTLSTPVSSVTIVSDTKQPSSPIPLKPDTKHMVTSTPVQKNDKQAIKVDDEELVAVNNDLDLMEELDVSKCLVMKKSDEDGPDIRGGYIDALIVQATRNDRKDFSYQEAFLTTYRTFISPYDLIMKLIRRYQYFICQPERKPRARESFALLVRVVNDLTISDLEEPLVQTVMDFVHQLVCSGDLQTAKPLRVTLVDKYNTKLMKTPIVTQNISLVYATLLDFKSEQIAEQMTLLDAELFMKIEIPEVLIWAQEQNEERSPNLTRFTEHFNKMSYWARTKILQAESRDREKYVMKFIKIMKHLRKINNFNSYLALLSALDSAPIRRLEWQKHITEGLKEYCALIDSSSSFRAYRQALAETSPPCIPYIGLVLQDLTFVHIGNSNVLPDGTINFSKRWQQYNIVENMKRFKKCTYTFKKNEKITGFFENFENYIGEDAMWQISESIKPRGGRKTVQ